MRYAILVFLDAQFFFFYFRILNKCVCLNSFIASISIWMTECNFIEVTHSIYMYISLPKITLDHCVVALSLLLRLLTIPLKSAIWMFLVVSKHIISISWCTITDIHIIHIHVCVVVIELVIFKSWTKKKCVLIKLLRSIQPRKKSYRTI